MPIPSHRTGSTKDTVGIAARAVMERGTIGALAQKTSSMVQSWQLDYHERVAEADPLGAHAALKRLPELNRDGKVLAVIQLLRSIAPSPETVLGWNFFEGAAAMRDIGMCLGSIKRHGVQPLEVLPDLSLTLFRLGELTHMPPRDTLLHYTLWNPSGANQRTYTLSPEEPCLIESADGGAGRGTSGTSPTPDGRPLRPLGRVR